MRSAKVSGAVEGGSGVKGRSDRHLMTQAGERQRENERSGPSTSPGTGETQFGTEFHLPHANTTADEYVSPSFITF